MAFSRNWLKSLSLTDEQVSAIIEEHTSVTDTLKAQRDEAKKEAEKVPGLQQQIDALKGEEDYKSKYEKEHQDFEDYKAGIAQKEETEKVRAAYRQLLTDEQIKADRLDMVIRHTDFANMKLDKDGKLTDVENLKKAINDDWGVFKVTTKERKQNVQPTPESGGGNGTSRARELYLQHQEQRYGTKDSAGKEKE